MIFESAKIKIISRFIMATRDTYISYATHRVLFLLIYETFVVS